ncbi:MAG: excisionase family DNA-binding protein [Anaerolineae bacterium]|jgi:excisionase family DNA binding protein
MSSSRPITTGKAAEYCSVSQATIVNWIKDGKLNGYTTPGGHYRIQRSDLVSFLRSYGMPIDSELQEVTHRNLLLLSDNPTISNVVNELGQRRGFEVCIATNEYAASAAVARSKPDAVIVDLNTSSDASGLCQWLSDTSESIAVLVIGNSYPDAPVRMAGVDIYLPTDALADLETKLEVLLQ